MCKSYAFNLPLTTLPSFKKTVTFVLIDLPKASNGLCVSIIFAPRIIKKQLLILIRRNK